MSAFDPLRTLGLTQYMLLMGLAATFAFITFFVGVVVLLGWLFANVENPRAGTMLGKSLLLFAVPIMLAPSQLFQFPLGMWAWVACEEALKSFASTREQKQLDKFWLVFLFGVWELTVDKPFWGIVIAQSGEVPDHLALAGVLYATALPVLMHAVTAAIYAFMFKGRLWAAFAASWVIHTTFNEAVTYFGISPAAAAIETAILGAILIALFTRRPSDTASQES
jgi:hypothetical protein